MSVKGRTSLLHFLFFTLLFVCGVKHFEAFKEYRMNAVVYNSCRRVVSPGSFKNNKIKLLQSLVILSVSYSMITIIDNRGFSVARTSIKIKLDFLISKSFAFQ